MAKDQEPGKWDAVKAIGLAIINKLTSRNLFLLLALALFIAGLYVALKYGDQPNTTVTVSDPSGRQMEQSVAPGTKVKIHMDPKGGVSKEMY